MIISAFSQVQQVQYPQIRFQFLIYLNYGFSDMMSILKYHKMQHLKVTAKAVGGNQPI